MKKPWYTNRWINVGSLVVFFTAVALTLTISDDDGDGKPDSLTIQLGGARDVPAGIPSGPDTLTLGEPGMKVLEDAAEGGSAGHDGRVYETPEGLPPAAATELPEYLERNAESNTLPDLSPLAAPQQRGCRTRLVSNFSGRNGVRPRVIVAHYTVSPNRPGTADVDGITAYFNRRATGVSSHYVIDADGNCNYIVRETNKAWTQASGNPFSISVEHIATGREKRLANPAGFAKSGRVYADIARRWDIPIRRGAINTRTCVPTRSGIVNHVDFGACGGGHHDIGPFPIGPLIEAAQRARGGGGESRKLRKWRRSHRVAHAKLRSRSCGSACKRRYRARNRTLHRLIAREER